MLNVLIFVVIPKELHFGGMYMAEKKQGIIRISDFDIADVNTEVAKQFLMKARCVNGKERKIKSLMFARKSIDNAINSLGMEVQDIQFKKIESSERSNSQTTFGNKQGLK